MLIQKKFIIKDGRLKIKSLCTVCGNKKVKYTSKWSSFLDNLVINYKHEQKKNNDIINKFLLADDKLMPELHLWDLKVKKYSACGPFTKHEQRIESFMKDGRLSHIFKNELDKACFQYDAAYNKYKDLKNRTRLDIVLKNRAYKIATDPRADGYQRSLASLVWKFLMKDPKKC